MDEEQAQRLREAVQRLDLAYYTSDPGRYFATRAAMLMRMGDKRVVPVVAELGEFGQAVLARLPGWDVRPELGEETRVRALSDALTVEAFALAHHAGEVLLRTVFAMDDGHEFNPIWLAMAEIRTGEPFIKRVRELTDGDMRRAIERAFLPNLSRAEADPELPAGVVAETVEAIEAWLRHPHAVQPRRGADDGRQVPVRSRPDRADLRLRP
jgi:hypothetical protein